MTKFEFAFIDRTGRDVTATPVVDGYVFADFFDCDLDGATEAALRAAYKGPDIDGIAVRWTAA